MAAGSAPTRSATVRKENGCSSVRLVGIRGQILPPEITLRGSEPQINPASSSYKLFEDITLVWQVLLLGACPLLHTTCGCAVTAFNLSAHALLTLANTWPLTRWVAAASPDVRQCLRDARWATGWTRDVSLSNSPPQSFLLHQEPVYACLSGCFLIIDKRKNAPKMLCQMPRAAQFQLCCCHCVLRS